MYSNNNKQSYGILPLWFSGVFWGFTWIPVFWNGIQQHTEDFFQGVY